jgi:agmatinase
MTEIERSIRGPATISQAPRFAGPATFARLPTLDEVGRADVAIVGIPFDGGSTYRPGARFGPTAVRHASRLLRPYHPELDVEPFALQQVADAGDVQCTPLSVEKALDQMTAGARAVLRRCHRLVAIGGDHTVALATLRAAHESFGPLAVVHFDAHLDTWSTYLDSQYNHGTPFRRAMEEGLLAQERCVHIGLRRSMPSRADISRDSDLGFRQVSATTVGELGPAVVGDEIRQRVADSPVYISIDIDVLDPAFAPGTGTPEPGGLSSRELLSILRHLRDLPVACADVVEVSPAYDHAEVTALAAAHAIYEILGLIAVETRNRAAGQMRAGQIAGLSTAPEPSGPERSS